MKIIMYSLLIHPPIRFLSLTIHIYNQILEMFTHITILIRSLPLDNNMLLIRWVIDLLLKVLILICINNLQGNCLLVILNNLFTSLLMYLLTHNLCLHKNNTLCLLLGWDPHILCLL